MISVPRSHWHTQARVENMTGGDLAVSPRLVPACPEVSLWSLNTRWPEAVEGGGGGGSSDCGGDSGVAEWMSGGSLCRRGAMVLQKNKGAYHWVVKSVGVDSEVGLGFRSRS